MGHGGLSANKPCTKCGREMPGAFKSPIPGFCGRCTDEVMRTLQAPGGDAAKRPRVSVVEVATGKPGVIGLVGFLLGALGLLAFAALAPGPFDGMRAAIRGVFGLG